MLLQSHYLHHLPSYDNSDCGQIKCKLLHDMGNKDCTYAGGTGRLCPKQMQPSARHVQQRQCGTDNVQQRQCEIGHVQVVHDESGRVWLMLHSGSRNIGNITAQNYDKIAQAQLTQQNIKVPGGLNYLEIDSKPGQEYLQVTLLEDFLLFVSCFHFL
jgi:RNA-splicing ligase RtcB